MRSVKKGKNNLCKAAVGCMIFGVLTMFAGCGKTEDVTGTSEINSAAEESGMSTDTSLPAEEPELIREPELTEEPLQKEDITMEQIIACSNREKLSVEEIDQMVSMTDYISCDLPKRVSLGEYDVFLGHFGGVNLKIGEEVCGSILILDGSRVKPVISGGRITGVSEYENNIYHKETEEIVCPSAPAILTLMEVEEDGRTTEYYSIYFAEEDCNYCYNIRLRTDLFTTEEVVEIIASVEPEGRSFLSKGVVLCHGVTISVTGGHSAWRDSRVNVEINKSVKYEWSRCMLLHSGMAAIIALVISFLSTRELPAMVKGISYLLLMLCTAGGMAAMFVADRNVRKVKNQADYAKYYDEDDMYYLLGKKNPNAPRVQERRLGIGFEINAGNGVETVIVALTMVFVIGIAIFLSRYDFADITMSFTEETDGRVQVRVAAADERDSFYTDEITEIELLENYPHMSKNTGYDGTVYNIGAFNVSGYGKCRTYVCLKTKPAIIVRTQDKTYLLNDESEAGTRELYDRLVEACGNGVQ